jgi:hypothetical protein
LIHLQQRHKGARDSRSKAPKHASNQSWKECAALEGRFSGSFEKLLVDGKPLKAHTDPNHFGRPVTWSLSTVPAGTTVEVQAPK